MFSDLVLSGRSGTPKPGHIWIPMTPWKRARFSRCHICIAHLMKTKRILWSFSLLLRPERGGNTNTTLPCFPRLLKNYYRALDMTRERRGRGSPARKQQGIQSSVYHHYPAINKSSSFSLEQYGYLVWHNVSAVAFPISDWRKPPLYIPQRDKNICFVLTGKHFKHAGYSPYHYIQTKLQ